MGLEFDHPQGAKLVMRHLYENGVWAIFSTLDPRVLQFKPGILLGPDLSTSCSTAPRSRSARRCAEVRGGAGARRRSDERDAADGRRRAARAGMMLERARWAATAFATFDRDRTQRIVEAVADGGIPKRRKVCRVGGRGDRHGRRRAQAASRTRRARAGIVERYGGERLRRRPRSTPTRKIVEVPRPAGVVLALTPSTNPVATVYFKVLLALMTRNAVVVSARTRSRARRPPTPPACSPTRPSRAGAPDGCVQVVEEPTIPLIEALMADRATDVIVATGGTAVVRAAYRSGNPALGVGPGNVPALVDATADLASGGRAAWSTRKAFDNSILCTNESVAIVEERVADAFERELGRHGAHVLDEDEAQRVREALYPDGPDRHRAGRQGRRDAGGGRGDPRAGRHPRAGRAVRARRARGAARAREAVPAARARARARRRAAASTPRGRCCASAAPATRRSIHSRDPRTILAYGAAVRVLRVAVNARGSTGRVGPRHQPRADDDDRHRLLRPLVADGEPRAPAPDPVDAAGLRLRPGRAVRRLRRPAAVVASGPSPQPVAAPAPTARTATLTRDEICGG